jgi:hypothetical protein
LPNAVLSQAMDPPPGIIARLAANDQAEIEARAAHIRADGTFNAQRAAAVSAAHDPGHRAGLVGVHHAGARELGHAARVLHHLQRFFVAAIPQAIANAKQLVGEFGMQEAGQKRCGGPRVFAPLGDNVAREQHRNVSEVNVRVLLADDLAYLAFVIGIGRAPEKNNHNALHAAVDQILQGFQHVVLIQRTDDLAE